MLANDSQGEAREDFMTRLTSLTFISSAQGNPGATGLGHPLAIVVDILLMTWIEGSPVYQVRDLQFSSNLRETLTPCRVRHRTGSLMISVELILHIEDNLDYKVRSNSLLGCIDY